MCFSTTASFAAGIVLSGIGVTTIIKSKEPAQKMFAAIPLVFGLQQFAEGFVWLSLMQAWPQLYHQIAVHVFLVFAMIVWPVWIPLAICYFEPNWLRKRVIGWISVIGIVMGFFSLYYLITRPSGAVISNYHIHYDLDIPKNLLIICGLIYLIPTIVSHFFSTVKGVPHMGVLVLISYLITRFLFVDHVLSVWCFFSAAISIMIYFIVKKRVEGTRKLRY